METFINNDQQTFAISESVYQIGEERPPFLAKELFLSHFKSIEFPDPEMLPPNTIPCETGIKIL